jgi:hypothetical protein
LTGQSVRTAGKPIMRRSLSTTGLRIAGIAGQDWTSQHCTSIRFYNKAKAKRKGAMMASFLFHRRYIY